MIVKHFNKIMNLIITKRQLFIMIIISLKSFTFSLNNKLLTQSFSTINIAAGFFSGFPGNGCPIPELALGLGMGMSALRHCRRRKARTVFSDPQVC